MEQRSNSNQDSKELTQQKTQLDQQRVILSELASQILTELNISTYKEFIKLAGAFDTLNAMRPYKKRNSLYLLLETRRKMNLKGNGPDAIAMPFYVAHSALKSPETTTVEIKERGVVGTIHDCIFKNASPEFCVAISHIAGDAFCEGLNPEYEIIWTHHLSAGDPYCRYVVKKKTAPYTNLDDLGKTLATLPRLNLPQEELSRVKGWILWHFWGCTVEGMMDYCGSEKTMEILGANANRIGLGAGAYLVQSGMIKQRDVTGVGQFIDLYGRGSEQYGDIIHSSDTEFSKEIVNCPFKDAPQEVCKQFELFFNGLCQAVNPNLQFKYSKMMTTGDRSCLWSVTKK